MVHLLRRYLLELRVGMAVSAGIAEFQIPKLPEEKEEKGECSSKEIAEIRGEIFDILLSYARDGDVGMVSSILKSGHLGELKPSMCYAILKNAEGKKGEGVVKFILNQYPALALRSAIRRGDMALAKHLVNSGADLHARDKKGRSMLMHAVMSSAPNRTRMAMAVLFWGMRMGNDDQLAFDPQQLEAADNKGRTALMLAVKFNRMDIVKLLLVGWSGKGADVNRVDNEGRTALVWAIANGRYDVALVLCEHDAKLPEQNPFTRELHYGSNFPWKADTCGEKSSMLFYLHFYQCCKDLKIEIPVELLADTSNGVAGLFDKKVAHMLGKEKCSLGELRLLHQAITMAAKQVYGAVVDPHVAEGMSLIEEKFSPPKEPKEKSSKRERLMKSAVAFFGGMQGQSLEHTGSRSPVALKNFAAIN